MQYKPEVDVKAELEYTSFFNKDWSKSQIEDAVNEGFKQATNKGVTSGSYSFSYKGEKVTMYLENGAVKTAYGDYTYTYEELLELVK